MNRKAKIIVYSLLIISSTISTVIIVRAINKRKALKNIFKKINDTTSVDGASATLDEDEVLKAVVGLNPVFWKNGQGSIKPNTALLISDKNAREIATAINENMGTINDDESAIISQFKKLKSQGAVSQVAYQYQNSLDFGDLLDDLESSLPEWGEDRISDLYKYLISLPY